MEITDLPTEQHRRDLLDLDLRPTGDQVTLMVADQKEVITAVQSAVPALAATIDAIASRLAGGTGRMVYLGAGTAGRMGLLDASECPPTFDSDRIVAVMAGGDAAAASALEAAEDDVEAGRRIVAELGIGPDDVAVGVTASGRTPYTVAAMDAAKERGALTVGVSCNPGAALSAHVDYPIEVPTGPELIAGSTRLKAGTAQKLVLNTLSTLLMVHLGRTFGNLMVNVRSTNEKLRMRLHRIVVDATGSSDGDADAALEAAGGDHKVAILTLLTGMEPAEANRRLAEAGGHVRRALES